MAEATNNELQRDVGRMEGEFIGMKTDISEIKKILQSLDKRLARIEARESELRGAWWVLAAIAGVIGALAYAILGHFWK